MKIRFDPPENKGFGKEAITSIIRYLIKLAEKLNIAFDNISSGSELDELKNEISNNRVYIRELCKKNGIAPPDEVSWKNKGGDT